MAKAYLSYFIPSLFKSRVIDLYTKPGQIGLYSSTLATSPDHNVGYAILAAGPGAAAVTTVLSDIIAASIVPALEQAAKEEAQQQFSGLYALSSGSNSSITITTDESSGLKVVRWINNLHDILEAIRAAWGLTEATDASLRLYPTGLQTSRRISFRAVVAGLTQQSSQGTGPFTESCMTWMAVDAMVYGSVGIGEFVFDVDDTGKAAAVSPRAMRVSLVSYPSSILNAVWGMNEMKSGM
ncbi:hypothetical protein BBP40_002451 [Aspergillus hancockii]|nr:hypothetical protein BBP40_002451 [Aspergillus hancockii]